MTRETRAAVEVEAYESARAAYLRKLNTRSRKYLDEFIGLKCSADMLAAGLFPNSKEVTESFAAYYALRHVRPVLDLSDPGITLYCIGDGTQPRTAATFAFRSAWQCHSIDPRLKVVGKHPRVQRLHCHAWTDREFVQSHTAETFASLCPVVVVAVHNHGSLDPLVHVISSPQIVVVSIPCCVEQTITTPGTGEKIRPDREYQDMGIWSPKRTVKIWNSVP